MLGGEEEAVAGLARLIQRYRVGAALIAAQPESAAYTQLVEQLQSSSRPLVGARPGTVLQLGAGARLETLLAGEDGAVVLLQFGAFRALIAHGTSAGWTGPLQARGLEGGFTTMLLPASGDSEATAGDDIDWLNPSLTPLAVQAGNRQGLPSPRLLQELSGRTVLRTDQHGWITLSTDGGQMWVEVQRTPAPPQP